jgi:tetratricopeptide (TPR) repeat protein
MPVSLMVLGAACYIGSLGGEFVWDDLKLVVNDVIRNPRHVSDVFLTDLWGRAGGWSNYYRPLPPLVFMALHRMFGQRPEPFHAVNILLHAGTCCLVFLLTRALLDRARRASPAPGGDGRKREVSARWAAYAAGLLFATHPIHAEAVAWISGMMDVSCAFFSLLAIYLHVTGDDDARGPLRRAISAAALLLALFSKEPAVVVPLLLVAYDLLYRRVSPAGLGRAWPRWAPSFAALALYLGLRGYALRGLLPFAQQGEGTVPATLVRLAHLFALYLQGLLLPVRLNAVHDIPAVVLSSPSAVWLSAIGVVVSVVIAWRAVRWGAAAAFGVLVYVMTLAPALFLPALRQNASLAFAERNLYLPSAGAAIVAAVAVERLASGRRRVALLSWWTCGALAVVFSVMSVSRAAVWRSGLSLWSDCVRKSPNVAFVHFNLALALEESGARDEAIREYRTTLAQDGRNVEALNNLGILLAQSNRLNEAIRLFSTALRIRPDDAEVRINLAHAYELAGQEAEAGRQGTLPEAGGRGPKRP